MAIVIICGAIVVALFLFGLAIKDRCTRPYSRRESVVAWVLLVIGLAFGIWAATSWEYQADYRTRIAGFPIPVAFFRLEKEVWIDYLPPPAMQAGAVIADTLLIAGVLMSSFAGWRAVERKWRKKKG